MDSSADDNDVIVIDDSSDDDDGSSVSVNGKVAAAAASAHPIEQQIENEDSIADEMDLTLQSLLAERSPAREPPQQHHDNDDIIDVDADEASFLSIASSSSSSSSGIPGPSPYKKTSHRPPSVIHTTSAIETNDDDDQAADEDDFDEDVAMSISSTASKNKRNTKNTVARQKAAAVTKSKAKKPAPKRSNTKNKKRTAKSKASSNASVNSSSIHTATSKTTISSNKNDDEDPTATKHFHCYLLRSLNPDHPLKTYIGFTTNPSRRIRQHNGILKNAGANKTKRAGRPWTFVAIIHGFQDKITALQFEWAWQNVDKSKAFREAVGDDALARKMKRRMGPKARLDELRWLLKDVQPFCLYSLTVYFPEREYCEIFRGIVARGKSGNPYKKDDDESECHSEMLESLLDIQVASVEDMPFAKELVALKEKKKALRQRKKEERQAAKKKKKDADAAAEYSSDISTWLETLDDNDDDDVGSWSDLLDESDDGKEANANQKDRRDLSAIEEDDNSSVMSFDLGNIKTETVSSTKQRNKGVGMDDISSTLQSISMDGASKKRLDDANKKGDAYDDCDFSTISSADSVSSNCLMKHGDGEPNGSGTYEDKENHEANKLSATPGKSKSCDFFDLCSP
eukprot:scaffold14210_cov122-Skeletonema_dohrnii-CCMP3373.AAC.4